MDELLKEELKNKTAKLQWDIFKDKEISNLISHMFNTTKVIFEEGRIDVQIITR